MLSYEPPELHDLGSLAEVTEQLMNKIGPTPDAVTTSNPNVVGSFVPLP